MHYLSTICVLGSLLLLIGRAPAAAQGTQFLYDGALTDAGGPALGDYDIRFRLFDAAQAGNQAGPDVTLAPVSVIDGRFAVTLDFGPGVFDGGPRWLELAVRSNGVVSAHAVLTPRQRILPLPYAMHAGSAASVTSNGITAAAIQNATLTAEKLASNQVVKSLNSLHDNIELRAGANITLVTNQNALVLSAFGGGGGGDDWHLLGNLGTTPGVNFLGTIDDEPLDVRVNNLRGLRLQPDAPTFLCDTISGTTGVGKSPSLIGGYFGNLIADGVAGAVIAGGGAFNHTCLGGEAPNIITADFAVISGGLGNRNDGAVSSIGGGGLNYIGSAANGSVIAGGGRNYLSGDNDGATIGGGGSNVLGRATRGSTIAGGVYNWIDQFSQRSTISGGATNIIGSNVSHAFIGGGRENTVHTRADYSSIGGGYANVIQARAGTATVGGGLRNVIQSGADSATIGGGLDHVIETNSIRATIGGGWQNRIAGTEAGLINGSTISGGYNNAIEFRSGYSTVGGGAANLIGTNVNGGTIGGGIENRLYAYRANIGGGFNNTLQNNSDYAVISGGGGNLIETGNGSSTLAGGSQNQISARAEYSVIGGGNLNLVAADSRFGVVDGGDHNVISDDFGAIGGGGSNEIKPGAGHSVIGGGELNVADTNSHHGVIGGGLRNHIATDAQQCFIGGGNANAIGPNSWSSTIAGGSGNLIFNSAGYSVLAGGWINTIGASAVSATVSGGYQNVVGINSPWSTVGGGQGNSVTNAQDATIAGGARNRIYLGSAAASISGGQENIASAIAATVPGGYQAHARDYGQQAYAGGRFVQNGDAQTSTFVVRGTTSDATPRELFLDGSSRRMTVPKGGAWTFEVLVVARDSGGASGGYKICGVIENNIGAGACVLVGAPEVAFEREDVPAWNATVVADDANDALVVRVFGQSGQSIRWVATVHTAEVIY